jgi:NAD(P)-dependent dehydrogenase (short-subunit alcohol dehydrogenase family)
MLSQISGKVALVTGAGSGIGRGLSEVLGNRGMRLVVSDINEEALAETAEMLVRAGVKHLACPLDIRDREAWHDVLKKSEQRLGPVQLLANVAGVTVAPTPALDVTPEAFSWVLDINLKGTWHGVQVVGNRLKALGLAGHIVNTASCQGLFASPLFSAYNASKFAIVGLSETLRIELSQHNIGVSVVCPGATRGNILNNSRRIAPELVPELKKIKSGVGWSHYLTPVEVGEQIADAVECNRLYVITHPELRPLMEARWQALDAALGVDAAPDFAANVCEVERAAYDCYRAEGDA